MKGKIEYERADAFIASNHKGIGSIKTTSGIYATIPAYKLIIGITADVGMASGPLSTRDGLFEVLGMWVHFISAWCSGRDFDLWDIICQKMAYNESRPALHGRKY